MQLGEGAYTPGEHRAMTDSVRIRASYRSFIKQSGMSADEVWKELRDSPLTCYTAEDIPFIVYYPASDRVELDPVKWKHGAGQFVATIH